MSVAAALPLPAPADAVGPEVFRRGMRRVAAAVAVVATDGPAGRCGFTASAVCPVSDEPPTLLVCMSRRSAMNPAFKANRVFCVNTLAAADRALADWFAGYGGVAMEERFRRAGWSRMATGAPALDAALVAFDCRLADVKEVATHSVMFGRVEAVRLGGEAPALVYIDRGYRGVPLAAG